MGNQHDKPNVDDGDAPGRVLHVAPRGLYEAYGIVGDDLARAIRQGQLAECGEGKAWAGADAEECPICFLAYDAGLNKAVCCKKGICTECFLQMQAEVEGNGEGVVGAQCPFCNAAPLRVVYDGATPAEVLRQLAQEQQAIEARQRRVAVKEKHAADARRQRTLEAILCLDKAHGAPSDGGGLTFPDGDDALAPPGGANQYTPAELRRCISCWRDHYLVRTAPHVAAAARVSCVSADSALEALLQCSAAPQAELSS